MIVNEHQISETVDLIGADAYSTLFSKFDSELETFCDRIAPDRVIDIAVADEAHKIAGSAATLGAESVRLALMSFETALRTDETDNLSTLRSNVIDMRQRTLEAIALILTN